LLLEEFFSLRLELCDSATDFLANECSDDFAVTVPAADVFVRDDRGVVLSTDDLFFPEVAGDPELLADEGLSKFSTGDESFSDDVITDACTLARSLLADFFSGDCVNALRRTREGRLYADRQHSTTTSLSNVLCHIISRQE